MRVLFTSLKQPIVTKPELVEGATKGQEVEHVENYKQYVKEQKSLESSLAPLYNVTWGQCSKLIQNKLCTTTNYEEFEANSDVWALLKQIKDLSNLVDENTSAYDSLHEAKVKLYTYKQRDDETLADHLQNFKDLVNTVEYYGGTPFYDETMLQYETNLDIKRNVVPVSVKEYKRRIEQKSKAMCFLKGSNSKRYRKLINSIREQHSFKIYVYPKTIVEAYELLSAHTSSQKKKRQHKFRQKCQ